MYIGYDLCVFSAMICIGYDDELGAMLYREGARKEGVGGREQGKDGREGTRGGKEGGRKGKGGGGGEDGREG